ncbi:hypothetical protein [Pseudonocardia sp. HH130630-07]|uniref:hypothetical protein n=1 Tax=Pseudonocardia sp. HH130630-07 TaxID=1690815 RepID=UPI000814B810|nr:hypothetical protein [Pseudonocardia sp. HH130630-07]ANY06856.1 hypothetical protein AFB00_11755 [Pseudonocardia sp. HH130630-07]
MDAERSSPEHPDPWATGRRRPGRPDRRTRTPEAPGRELQRRPPPRDEAPHTVEGSVAEPAAPPPGRAPGSGDPWRYWRSLRPRSVRGASALGLVGAAVFLFPFLDEPGRWWVPAGLGFGTLLLLTLFRLDRLLKGWTPHVAGVVLVAALVHGTRQNPWVWGLALAAGVVVAGLLLLPRWKVLAVGMVLVVLAGTGYAFRSAEIRDDRAAADAQQTAQFRTEYGVPRPQLALLGLDSAVVENNPARACWFARPPAVDQLKAATGAPGCDEAIAILHARVPAGADVTAPDRKPDPDVEPGASVTVDGCATTWAQAAGPDLGRVVLTRTPAATPAFQISGFGPC